MSTVRLNITLPTDIAGQLDQIAGPKGKSSFIAECIRQRIALLEKDELNQLLTEGYKKRKSENLSLSKEFEAIDIEGWDEY